MGFVSFFVSFIVSLFVGFIGVFMVVCMGIVMGYYFKKKQFGYVVVFGVLVYVLCGVVFFVVSIVFFNMNVVDNIMFQFWELLFVVDVMLKQLGYGDQFGKQMKLMENQLSMF